MATSTNAADTIKQLEQARLLCLADPNSLYTQIVPGLSPIINASADLELRRWGTEFLSETFASPVLAADQKQKLSVQVVEVLKGYLDKEEEDAFVIKSVVQTASSIYPFIVRHTISNPTDEETWKKMSAIKSSILRRMDSATPGIRLCCGKFIQKVVQVQTPGMIADPRRPDHNEISLALVPRDHPLIPYANLEAEASGLLDRLLGVLQDSNSDALLVTATLNSLASLVRGRASISNKIISTVLAFNPFALAQAQSPISIKNKLLIRSMTRTTMSFLANILKKNQQHPLAGRIHGTLDRLRQSLLDIFDDTRRKRAAPDEPADGLLDAKRQRLGVETPPDLSFPPSHGPATFAQLFTLTQDQGLRDFDVKVIAFDMASRIVPFLLASIDAAKLDAALNLVRSRYLKLLEQKARASAEEDEDYEPDYPTENREQILNHLDQTGGVNTSSFQPPEIALGTFNLPKPPSLSSETAVSLLQTAVTRVFATLSELDGQAIAKSDARGIHRLAASSHDRQGWATILTRLATRASVGLDYDQEDPRPAARRPFCGPDATRDALYMYIMDNFRRRIDIAIAWLNEEWYNDRLAASEETAALTTNGDKLKAVSTPSYTKWLYRILDGFLPFLDAKDRLLIRFLSEVPDIDSAVISKVVKLAADPDRVTLAVQALQYLIMFRPPARELCLDGMETLWRDYEEARNPAQKVLVKYRPAVVEAGATNGHVAVKTEQ